MSHEDFMMDLIEESFENTDDKWQKRFAEAFNMFDLTKTPTPAFR